MQHRPWTLPGFHRRFGESWGWASARDLYLLRGIPECREFDRLPDLDLSVFTVRFDWYTRILIENMEESMVRVWEPKQPHPERYCASQIKWGLLTHWAEGMMLDIDDPSFNEDSHYWLTSFLSPPDSEFGGFAGSRAFQLETMRQCAQSILDGKQPTPKQRVDQVLSFVMHDRRGAQELGESSDIAQDVANAVSVMSDYDAPEAFLNWVKAKRLHGYLQDRMAPGGPVLGARTDPTLSVPNTKPTVSP